MFLMEWLSEWILDKFGPRGEPLEFDNLNFKLAIIQNLMYEQDVLKPKYMLGPTYFQIYNDVKEVSDEVALKRLKSYIDEGERYFQNLEIPSGLARKVTYLECNVDTAIYFHINPQWDDYKQYFDDGHRYDVTAISEDELSQFPNLEYIRFGAKPPEALVRQLLEWGYEVEIG